MAKKKQPRDKPKPAGKPAKEKKKRARSRTGAGQRSSDKQQPAGETTADEAAATAGFPIVGIGASAGGLEALKTLMDAAPDDLGVAFVVIQHLDPTVRSLAPELLAKHTRMRVTQVADDPHVKSNRVYVIPPGKYLTISDGTLHLHEPDQPRGARMAIDHFLRSLAEDQRQRAVGVVLSGTGTDGTLGIKAIKARGGMVIAQDPATAAHDGMPRSAMATGAVDHVLPPEKMPEVLARYAEHPYVRESDGATPEEEESPELESETAGKEPAEPEQTRDGIKSILALLRVQTQHDFNNYKDRTLLRRTRRRMCLHHLEEFSDYLDYLHAHPGEIEPLVKDLLITVTDFYRDPEAWGELERRIVPDVVEAKDDGDPVRVWTPGCATGEEPYSLTMLLLEQLQRTKKDCPLKIFASDIDKDTLDFAREGRYPRSIEADVSAERLGRFFTKADDDDHFYRVGKPLREAVVFSEQNLISDPPFSKLDLICCRNLLIYLKPEIQEKIITLFHFALAEGGYLFLGNSETIGRHDDLFQTVDKRWRIYRRIGPTRNDRVDIPVASGAGPRHEVKPRQPPDARDQTRLAHLAQQHLLDWLAPSAVLVDRNWRILFVSGEVDDYLTHTPGVPSDDLLQKCRRGLRSKLRGAVRKVLDESRPIAVRARVQRGGQYHDVRLIARPLPGRDEERELALVVFEGHRTTGVPTAGDAAEDKASASGQGAATTSHPHDEDLDGESIIRQLDDELAATREDLQTTIEQYETSNEEFKAANEEVMSINEELQSTNEELETSKEELQSLNEELSTVNSQLAGKVEELETKHADLQNLIPPKEDRRRAARQRGAAAAGRRRGPRRHVDLGPGRQRRRHAPVPYRPRGDPERREARPAALD